MERPCTPTGGASVFDCCTKKKIIDRRSSLGGGSVHGSEMGWKTIPDDVSQPIPLRLPEREIVTDTDQPPQRFLEKILLSSWGEGFPGSHDA